MGPEEGAAPPREVRFRLLGPVPRPLAEGVVTAVSRRLAVPCRLAGEPWPAPLPRLEGRDQVDADALLDTLTVSPPPEGVKLVGLTSADLGVLLFTHVFGRAQHGGPGALVSTARLVPEAYGLPPDHRLAVRRTAREALHELGHTVGLGHCPDWGCIMRFASDVESADQRGDRFCAACAALLPDGFLARRGGRGPGVPHGRTSPSS